MSLPLAAPSAAAALVGTCLWYFFFHRFETHMLGVNCLIAGLLSCIAVTAALTNLYHQPVAVATRSVATVGGSFLLGAYGSMLVWRAFLNPLNRLPGPWLARISNFWFSIHVRNADAYYKLQALHQKYGRIVRIGSNDLSITDPTIMEAVYGRNSSVVKGHWYDNDKPLTSMHTTRDKGLHDRRRKWWVPAFSEKAVRDYESRISGFRELLAEKIANHKGQPVDVSVWFNLFSFDAMALLAFGKDYGMLERGEKHWALELLSEGMQPMAFFPTPWFFQILAKIPGAAAGYLKFVRFCVNELTWRVEHAKEAETKGSDIMSWILRAYKDVPYPHNDTMLQADSRLIIVAGSDTTSACLTYLFYNLAKYPEVQRKLREELEPLTRGEWQDANLTQAKYLQGCIQEALRLHPPVPSGVQRMMPPEGMEVDGRHIPGGTVFWMPQYVMGRDPTIYDEPESFIPERWYSKEYMVKYKDAWAPFSMGPFNCIGKSLAWMELRTVTATLIKRFDVSFAPGEDGSQLLYKTKDHFTVSPGRLDLVFTAR